MRSHPRQGVWIAIASLVASIVCVVWWASARTAATDAGAAGDSASRPDTSEDARAELEVTGNELSTARATAASPVTEVAATSEMPDAAELPPGQIRLRLVDAQGQRLTRLKGFLGIERDPLTRAATGPGNWPAWRIESGTGPYPRRAWNVTIPESGEFVFESLELGKWNVDCQADDFRVASADVFLSDATPRREVELVVARQRAIEVSFRTPDGEPFLTALQRAFPRYGQAVRPRLRRTVDRGASGVVEFTTAIGPAHDATYWRTLRADSFESLTVSAFVGGTLLASVDAPAGVESVSLVASVDTLGAALGSLSVFVVDDETELPVARVSIECGAEGFDLPDSTSDANGRVEFTDVVGPDVSVTARRDGYAPATRVVRMFSGRRTETIVRLERGVTISGVLRMANGQETYDFMYLAAFDEGSKSGELVDRRGRRGSTFEFEHLSRAQYVAFSSAATRDPSVKFGRKLELQEPPDVAAQGGRLPEGLVYIDARHGSVSDVVLLVPVEVPK